MDIDLAVLRGVERERDISLDVLIPAIEQALLLAYQRTDGSYRNARAELDRKTGHVTIWAREEFEVPVEDDVEAELELGLVVAPAQGLLRTVGVGDGSHHPHEVGEDVGHLRHDLLGGVPGHRARAVGRRPQGRAGGGAGRAVPADAREGAHR